MLLLILVLLAFFEGTRVSGVDVLTDQEVDVVTQSLKAFHIGRCVLVCETRDMSVAVAVKKLTKSLILTTFTEPKDLERLVRESKVPDSRTGIVIKVKKSVSVKDVFVKNYNKLFWFFWFLMTEDDLDQRIRIPFNCLFFLIRKESENGYRLVENYHVKNSTTFENDYGTWSRDRGLIATPLSFYERRKNLKGVELVRSDAEHNQTCDRYKTEQNMKILWSDLSKFLNFTLKLVNISMNTTSKTVPDGSTCIYLVTKENSHQDWIFSSFTLNLRLITKFRSSNEVGWRAYVRPFQNEIWAAIGVWLVLSTLTLVVVGGCTKQSLLRNIFTSFVCLCNSDPMTMHSPTESISLSTQLVHLTMLTVPSVIIPAYSAYILSTLSIVLPVEPFNDLNEFIQDGTFKLTTINSPYFQRLLKTREESTLKRVIDNFFVGLGNMAPTFFDLFEQLCQDNQLAGIFLDTRSFRSFFKCKMFIMQKEVATISSGYLLQKGFPLRRLFVKMFNEYNEKAIIYKTEPITKSTPDLFRTYQEGSEDFSSLNIRQMSAIFLLIPLGVILSLASLALEIWIHKRKSRKHRSLPVLEE